MRRRFLSPLVSIFALAVVGAGSAAAHTQLDSPARRYDDMKGAVCGKGGGADARTTHFSRFEPGETIDVSWTETIDHVGTFRIAFDDDGADRDDFDANVLKTIDDPDNASGAQYTESVTLPDIECNNCTLQLKQVMSTGAATDDNTYFQCADLVLGEGESAPPGGSEAGTGCASNTLVTPAAAALSLLLLRRRRR